MCANGKNRFSQTILAAGSIKNMKFSAFHLCRNRSNLCLGTLLFFLGTSILYFISQVTEQFWSDFLFPYIFLFYF
ncbi:hypothetical protein ATPR_1805 [Acetobacter tropicalis NBRC 101654]|uniref:Uncharacterized protein n=1 Tax=Acetobacter tropicalis NBRC 101654 TaxID=749388 RepID=F7VEK6_9PROT|nr:hypothetical protein ATPR_1805 [Acetobacter tropicalis NBRC 101654]